MTLGRRGTDDFSRRRSDDDFDDGLSDDLRARVKGELEPGERLLWAARSDPRSSVWFRRSMSSARSRLCFSCWVLLASCARRQGSVHDGSEMSLG